jgi:hypothetical protein
MQPVCESFETYMVYLRARNGELSRSSVISRLCPTDSVFMILKKFNHAQMHNTYAYMHTYIHTYIHTHTHTHIHTDKNKNKMGYILNFLTICVKIGHPIWVAG